MRFTIGLSVVVVTLGVFAVLMNLSSPGLMLISVLGIGFAVVPLFLLRWISRMGLSPQGVRWTHSRLDARVPRGRRP